MPVFVHTDTTGTGLRPGDRYSGKTIDDVDPKRTNVAIKFTDGTSRSVPMDTDVTVERPHRTWAEEGARAAKRLDVAVSRVMKHIERAEAGIDSKSFQAEIAGCENPAALVECLRWSAGRWEALQSEVIWRRLGEQIRSSTRPAHEVMCRFLDRTTTDLVQSRPLESSSALSRFDADARRSAMVGIVDSVSALTEVQTAKTLWDSVTLEGAGREDERYDGPF